MIISIALGGAAGTLLRWWMFNLASRYSADFPYGTLSINVVGSLILGFLVRFLIATPTSPELRAALTVGFCGGFTTFSAFSFEAAALLEGGNYARAFTYMVGSVALSVAATFAGFAIARAVLAPRGS